MESCIPNFRDTSPFYLKILVAVLHIASTGLVLDPMIFSTAAPPPQNSTSPTQPLSNPEWSWPTYVERMTGMGAVHRAVGGAVYSMTPMLLAISVVVASMLPSIVTRTRHQKDVCTMMVHSMSYMVTCMYVVVWTCVRALPGHMSKTMR
jgi:hypothetical protein